MNTLTALALGLLLASAAATFAAVIQHIARWCEARSDTRAERALAAFAATLLAAAVAAAVLAIRTAP